LQKGNKFQGEVFMSDDLAKVEEIIKISGNTFHAKVLKRLASEGWTVKISPYYNDNISNKPREIDLIAEKAFPIYNAANSFEGNVIVKLFVECKYLSQITVFWFHKKDE
jgi:hypothetical protein